MKLQNWLPTLGFLHTTTTPNLLRAVEHLVKPALRNFCKLIVVRRISAASAQ